VSVILIGASTLGHAKAMLTGLTVTPAVCSARIASTMLCCALPVELVFGNAASDNRVADKGTQAFIASEEEEFVFLDRPAHHAAKLL